MRWLKFCVNQVNLELAKDCSYNVPSCQFWNLASDYSDKVTQTHVQIRLTKNSDLNGGVLWLEIQMAPFGLSASSG